MKVLIKKSFAGYPEGHIIQIDENKKCYYTDVTYWLRRCKEGEKDGYCELIEGFGKKLKNMIKSSRTSKKTK